jgi:predicted small secreted protein
MKKLVITVCIVLAVASLLTFACYNTPIIDMRGDDMTDSTHTFRFYPNAFAKPTASVTIPLVYNDKGKKNYPGNPSTSKFHIFLAKCVIDTNKMNMASYTKFINK